MAQDRRRKPRHGPGPRSGGNGSEGSRKGPGGDDYEVGYGKPPRDSQWQPGQSGNPKGPQKRAAGGADAAFKKVLSRRIGLVDRRGRRKSVSAEEAIWHGQVERALKGDVKAATLVFARLDRLRSAEPETQKMPELSPEESEILESLLGKNKRKRRPQS